MFARDIKQIVTNENTRQIDVRSEQPQLRVDFVMMGVEGVELAVNTLRAPRQREHRHRDQHQETPESQRGNRPGAKAHPLEATAFDTARASSEYGRANIHTDELAFGALTR